MKGLNKLVQLFYNSSVETKLKENPVIIELKNSLKDHFPSIILTGGAPIDILEKRTPKDYDLYVGLPQEIIINSLKSNEHFRFMYNSLTAVTYKFKDEYVVQFLRKNPSKFVFTISATEYDIKNEVLIYFDHVSRKYKMLIPRIENISDMNSYHFKNRIKHWKNKRYQIHPITKKSFLKKTKSRSIFLNFIRGFLTNNKIES